MLLNTSSLQNKICITSECVSLLICILGVISLSHWASATESVLKLGLPWRVLRPQLVSSTKYGMVDYQQWIKELSITEPKLEVITVLPSC